jgi:NAD(P)-dependent dehydrogenase (short-subunit alcohol dehydrogenase family)
MVRRAGERLVSFMTRLDGRVAIVTGAGRGIGRSVALLLAQQGAAVVVNDLGGALDGSGSDAGPAQQVVNEITEAGGKAAANTADVSGHSAADELVREAAEGFGRLDVLVNVAGILRDRMVFNMTEQEWDDVIRVHLKGTFNTTKFASAHWRSLRDRSAQNRIINFTSVSGLHGAPGQPNYAAAKMGIVGLTYSSAHALARYGVTVNAISPGAATRMTESVPEERRRVRGRRADERSPDNVAPIVAYLASEQSGWINGRILHAAGYEVALYSNPEPLIRLIGTAPWDVGALAGQVERSFGPLLGRQG